MWQKRSYLNFLLATFLAFGFTAMVWADGDDDGEGRRCRIAGTYWVDIDPDGLKGLLTLTADGRVILVNNIGNLGANVTAGYGNWEKNGRRSAKGRIINFGLDGPGLTIDVTFEGEFDSECEYLVLPFELLGYAGFVNPMDPGDLPVFSPQGTFYAQRIPTE